MVLLPARRHSVATILNGLGSIAGAGAGVAALIVSGYFAMALGSVGVVMGLVARARAERPPAAAVILGFMGLFLGAVAVIVGAMRVHSVGA
jgi:hypothetical protein